MVIEQEKLKKQLIDKNYTKGIIITPKYIVVHDTDNRDFGSTAKFNRDYLAVNSRIKTSAHYIVDDKIIIQLLEDRWRGWHVTDSTNSLVTNSNSIGVKMCVNRGSNIEKTMDNMLLIIKYLMKKYDIPKENVVRHYDVSGKICPRMMIEDNPSLWTSLIEAIEDDNDKVTLYRIISKGYLNPVLTKLNIKSQKDRTSTNIGVINRNEEFNIYEFDGEWAKIITKDNVPKFGYIKRDFVEILDKKEKKIVKILPSETTLSKLQEEVKEEVAGVKEPVIDIKVDSKVEVEIANPVVKKKIPRTKIEMDENGVVSNTTMNLAVRKGPDNSFYVISYLLPGEKVRVIEQDNEWYHILYNSNRGERFGYVEVEYIDIKK